MQLRHNIPFSCLGKSTGCREIVHVCVPFEFRNEPAASTNNEMDFVAEVLCENPRNIEDDELCAIAIGIMRDATIFLVTS